MREGVSRDRATGTASRSPPVAPPDGRHAVTGRGAGTQISGRVMLAIAPDLLADVAAGRRVAIVSATNGKTTTTRLLAEALRAPTTAVVSNHTGANMPAGVAAALGRDRDASVAVLEVDERWVPKVVDPLGTELLVLGNLTRDQLDRFGEVRSIATRWRDVCTAHPDLAVVANASDPHVVWSVGAGAPTSRGSRSARRWRSDAATCPECAALLTLDRGPVRLPGVRLRPAGCRLPARRRHARHAGRRRSSSVSRCPATGTG